MALIILTRHARSTLNVEGRVNGDPAVPVGLTDDGEREAARLGRQLAHVPIDLCVHTRFERTRLTAEIALHGREVPLREEPLLDDLDVGDLEGATLDAYRAWKAAHTREEAFPGGESLDDAARRFARAFRAVIGRGEATTLVVCHEIPIRYALNAAAGSDRLDAPEHFVPNATPYLFDERSLARAVDRMEKDAGPARRITHER